MLACAEHVHEPVPLYSLDLLTQKQILQRGRTGRAHYAPPYDFVRLAEIARVAATGSQTIMVVRRREHPSLARYELPFQLRTMIWQSPRCPEFFEALVSLIGGSRLAETPVFPELGRPPTWSLAWELVVMRHMLPELSAPRVELDLGVHLVREYYRRSRPGEVELYRGL